jgi:benzoyl-CoA reductase/2-hydroxyglutaryl-CoA dehydratase subunit BcrC/BadD/HgdB
VLPVTSAPDQAGSMLHDNMCPHVKRVLDRALASDLPDLAGMVFMNSCESMRRLADAWRVAMPHDKVLLVDLPSTGDEPAVRYLAGQFGLLRHALGEWAGRDVPSGRILLSARRYDEMAARMECLARRPCVTRKRLQGLMIRSVTRPIDETIAEAEALDRETAGDDATRTGVPVYLFGNVLPDEDAIDLLERSGCAIMGDDLCTASRQLARLDVDQSGDLLEKIAAAYLRRPPCGRSVSPASPGRLADRVVAQARACGARGVIAHVVKFCDPFLARMPAVRRACEEAGIPLLVLEGDCTLRSLGQGRTRIEAFVEMLQGERP